MIFSIEEQKQSWVGWSLFFSQLYDFKDKGNKDKDLWSAIGYMIGSPISFIDELLHEINVAKLISSRSSISHNEVEIYELLLKVDRKITFQLQK